MDDMSGGKTKNSVTHCQDDTELQRQISILSILLPNSFEMDSTHSNASNGLLWVRRLIKGDGVKLT